MESFVLRVELVRFVEEKDEKLLEYEKLRVVSRLLWRVLEMSDKKNKSLKKILPT